MSDRYTSMGKEILRDGAHFADALSPAAAEAIVLMLNRGVLFTNTVSQAEAYLVLSEIHGVAA